MEATKPFNIYKFQQDLAAYTRHRSAEGAYDHLRGINIYGVNSDDFSQTLAYNKHLSTWQYRKSLQEPKIN